MSWNGTVRCGHCYGKGHNKRSCPSLKQWVEENPDSWRAEKYKDSKKRGKVRRCPYCNLKGHNRRTCGNLKIAKAHWIKEAQKYRKAWAAWMVEDGTTPGAIVKWKDGWGDTEVLMLREFVYKNVNHELRDSYYAEHGFTASYLNNYAHTRGVKMQGHSELAPSIGNKNTIEVIAPVKTTAKKILDAAPEWFRAGYANQFCNGLLDDVFNKERQSEDYWENGEKD